MWEVVLVHLEGWVDGHLYNRQKCESSYCSLGPGQLVLPGAHDHGLLVLPITAWYLLYNSCFFQACELCVSSSFEGKWDCNIAQCTNANTSIGAAILVSCHEGLTRYTVRPWFHAVWCYINYLSYGLAKWTDFLLLVAGKGIPRIG